MKLFEPKIFSEDGYSPDPRLYLTALAVVLSVLSAFLYMAFAQGNGVMTGDDAERTFFAWQWFRHPGFTPTPNWLPLPFWAMGASYFIFKDIFLGPVMVNVAFGFGALWFLYRMCRLLFGDNLYASLAAVAAAAFSFNRMMEGLLPSSDPAFWFFTVGGLFYLLRWHGDGSKRDFWTSLLFFGASALTRFEGWIFCLLFFAVGLRKERKWSGAVIFIFPLMWLIYQAWLYHDPFYFLGVVKPTNFDHPIAFPNWENLEAYFRLFFLSVPFAGWGVLLSSGKYLRDDLKKVYFLFAFGPLFLFAGLGFLFNLQTMMSHLIIFQLLLCPLAATAFCAAVERRSNLVKTVFIFALIPLLAASVLETWRPSRSPEGDAVSIVVRRVTACCFGPEDSIIAEIPDGLPVQEIRLRRNYPFIWRSVALPHILYLDRVFRYVRNESGELLLRRNGNPSLLEKPELQSWLESNHVRFVIVQSEWGEEKLKFWRKAGEIGPYKFYSAPGDGVGNILSIYCRIMARSVV